MVSLLGLDRQEEQGRQGQGSGWGARLQGSFDGVAVLLLLLAMRVSAGGVGARAGGAEHLGANQNVACATASTTQLYKGQLIRRPLRPYVFFSAPKKRPLL